MFAEVDKKYIGDHLKLLLQHKAQIMINKSNSFLCNEKNPNKLLVLVKYNVRVM